MKIKNNKLNFKIKIKIIKNYQSRNNFLKNCRKFQIKNSWFKL